MSDSEQQGLVGSRVESIDALRGFDMFWIVGGGAVFNSLAKMWKNPVTETIQQQLKHVKWEGFHFQDLIWPLFLFIVGVVLPFSVLRHMRYGQSRGRLYLRIVRRTVVLILLGLLMRRLLRFDWEQMNWTSVLGRIGICYLFAALMVIHTTWRTQAAVVALALVLYWAAMTLIPVPGYGAGLFSQEGTLVTYIDNLLLPAGQAYRYKDGSGVIIPTLPAVCTVLLGVLAGHWIGSNRSPARKTAGLALAGVVCVIIGWVWGLSFPINKKLWTSSFVLYSTGWSLLLFTLFYWVIDVKGCNKWAFLFIVIGMNPIAIYFAQSFINFGGIANYFVEGIAGYTGSFKPSFSKLSTLAAKWLFLWFLYRHKIFFKV